MGEFISKLKNVYRKYGFWGFLRKAGSYFRANYLVRMGLQVRLQPEKYRAMIRAMLDGDYDRIVLWRSSFGYDVPLYQRPQHIAHCFSQMRTLVLYEVTTITDRVQTMRKKDDLLYLVDFNNLPLRMMLMEELLKIDKPKYLQIYSTNWEMPLTEMLDYQKQGFRVLYEYVDEISPDVRGTETLPKNISDKYDYVMAHKDCTVVVTADLLEQDVIAHRGTENMVFSSNGVDYEFFQHYESYTFEPEFRSILQKGKPILCYYGALAKWFDYDLIKTIARTGKYSIVLFGVNYDGSFKRHIRDEENVYFLGPRNYDVLKYYAREADVLMIPFLINDVTRATNPLKIFEYMAMHKPVVTTDMNECRKYRSVLIGHDHAEFLEQIERALELRQDADYLRLLEQEARQNDWSGKAAAILSILE